MGSDPLRILILEDVPMDAELVEYELERARVPFESRRVDTRERFLEPSWTPSDPTSSSPTTPCPGSTA